MNLWIIYYTIIINLVMISKMILAMKLKDIVFINYISDRNSWKLKHENKTLIFKIYLDKE